MSLRYREGGTKAFQRLQGKIYDPSIFAWNTLSEEQLRPRDRARKSWERFSITKLEQPDPPALAAFSMLLGLCHPGVDPADKELAEMVHPVGLLATSPKAFRHCSGIVTEPMDLDWRANGQKISIALPASDDAHSHLVLPCRLGDGKQNFIAVPLTSYSKESFYRAGPWKVVDSGAWNRWPRQQLWLSTTDPIISRLPAGNREVLSMSLAEPRMRINRVHSLEYWVSPDTIEWSVISESRFTAGAVFSVLVELPDNGGVFAILISRTEPISSQPNFITFLNPIGLSCHVVSASTDTTQFSLEALMMSQQLRALQTVEPSGISATLSQKLSSGSREFLLTVKAPTEITEGNAALRHRHRPRIRLQLGLLSY